MPRSVIDNGDDHSVKTRWWHEQQAHARALREWACDPRGEAWVPGRHVDVQVSGDHHDLFVRDQVVIRVRVEAFLLDADLDPVKAEIFGMPIETDASLKPDGWRIRPADETPRAEVFLPDGAIVRQLDGLELKAGHTYEVRVTPTNADVREVRRHGPGGDAL